MSSDGIQKSFSGSQRFLIAFLVKTERRLPILERLLASKRLHGRRRLKE
jgi:hypothetical protein